MGIQRRIEEIDDGLPLAERDRGPLTDDHCRDVLPKDLPAGLSEEDALSVSKKIRSVGLCDNTVSLH